MSVRAHTEVAVRINDTSLGNLVKRCGVSNLFDREAHTRIGPQSSYNLTLQKTGAQYRPQTTGIQWNYAY